MAVVVCICEKGLRLEGDVVWMCAHDSLIDLMLFLAFFFEFD